MNCEWVEKQLMDEGSIGLDGADLDHVHQCPECRKLYHEVASLEQLNQSLKAAARAPSDFSSKVVSASFMSWIGWRAAWGLVAVLLAVVTLSDSSTSWGVQDLKAFWNDAGSILESRPSESISSMKTPSRSEADSESSTPYVEVKVEDRSGAPVVVRIPAQIEVLTRDLHPDVYLHQTSY
jgi:predicted anti-sigma-YlaC factor YlaD